MKKNHQGSEAEDTDDDLAPARGTQSGRAPRLDATDPRWSTIRPSTRDRFEQPRERIPGPPIVPGIPDAPPLRSEDRIQMTLPPELAMDLRALGERESPVSAVERASLAERLQTTVDKHQASMRPLPPPRDTSRVPMFVAASIAAVALVVLGWFLRG